MGRAQAVLWTLRAVLTFLLLFSFAVQPLELMMLPTDIALIEDEAFKPWVDAYAEDKDLFFADFSKVFAKLVELGVDRTKPVRIPEGPLAPPTGADSPLATLFNPLRARAQIVRGRTAEEPGVGCARAGYGIGQGQALSGGGGWWFGDETREGQGGL